MGVGGDEMIKVMCAGVLAGAIGTALLVVWANETNIGLQLKSLDCVKSSSLGVNGYVCYVEGM